MKEKSKANADVSRVEKYKKYALVLLMILFIIVLSIIKPNYASRQNLINILRQVSINGLIAIGMTFVIISGGIDLSVGSIAGVGGIVGALLAQGQSANPAVAIIVGCLVGILLGLINGIIIAYVGVPPFIECLGMMSVARGIAYLLTNAHPVNGLCSGFLAIGKGYFCGIPIPVIIMIVLFLIALFVLYKTKFGRYIYAIGGNEEAALVSGLKVKVIKVSVYAIIGFCSALAGMILTARVGSGLAVSGEGYEMDAIAAVVIGGASLNGGEGSLWGTALGILLLGIINNGLDMLSVSSYWQLVIKGIIIVLSVTLDIQTKKHAK